MERSKLLVRVRGALAALVFAMLTPASMAGMLTISFTSEIDVFGQVDTAQGSITIADDIDDGGFLSILGGSVTIGDAQFDADLDAGATFGRILGPQHGLIIDYGPQIWGLEFRVLDYDPADDPFERLLSLTLDDLVGYDPTLPFNGSAFYFFLPGGPFTDSYALTSFSVTGATAIPEPPVLALLLLAGFAAVVQRRRR